MQTHQEPKTNLIKLETATDNEEKSEVQQYDPYERYRKIGRLDREGTRSFVTSVVLFILFLVALFTVWEVDITPSRETVEQTAQSVLVWTGDAASTVASWTRSAVGFVLSGVKALFEAIGTVLSYVFHPFVLVGGFVSWVFSLTLPHLPTKEVALKAASILILVFAALSFVRYKKYRRICAEMTDEPINEEDESAAREKALRRHKERLVLAGVRARRHARACAVMVVFCGIASIAAAYVAYLAIYRSPYWVCIAIFAILAFLLYSTRFFAIEYLRLNEAQELFEAEFNRL